MKIDISNYDTTTAVAEKLGVARTTLSSALDRGEVKFVRTQSQLVLVNLTDALRWMGVYRRPGPKCKLKPNPRNRKTTNVSG